MPRGSSRWLWSQLGLLMRMILMWWRSKVLKVVRIEGREDRLIKGRGLECRVVVVFKLETPECEYLEKLDT